MNTSKSGSNKTNATSTATTRALSVRATSITSPDLRLSYALVRFGAGDKTNTLLLNGTAFQDYYGKEIEGGKLALSKLWRTLSSCVREHLKSDDFLPIALRVKQGEKMLYFVHVDIRDALTFLRDKNSKWLTQNWYDSKGKIYTGDTLSYTDQERVVKPTRKNAKQKPEVEAKSASKHEKKETHTIADLPTPVQPTPADNTQTLIDMCNKLLEQKNMSEAVQMRVLDLIEKIASK